MAKPYRVIQSSKYEGKVSREAVAAALLDLRSRRRAMVRPSKKRLVTEAGKRLRSNRV